MRAERLLEELETGATMIRALVSGFSPDEARERPAPSEWSALEVVCHLYDEEREDFRPRLEIALHGPGREWPSIDPEGWVYSRRYNERDPEEMLAAFLEERRRSLAWLRGLVAPEWGTSYQSRHGSIHAGDLLASWVAHDGLHLRQLCELRRARLLHLVTPYDVAYAGE